MIPELGHFALILALVLSLVAAGIFFIPTGEGAGGPPQMVFLQTVLKGKVSDVAPLLGSTPEAIVAKLNEGGLPATADDRLHDVAAKAGKSDMHLLEVLNAAKAPAQ